MVKINLTFYVKVKDIRLDNHFKLWFSIMQKKIGLSNLLSNPSLWTTMDLALYPQLLKKKVKNVIL